MPLIKKIFLANVLGVGIAVPAITYAKPSENIAKVEQNTTLKKWRQLLTKISGKDELEKLSKVFSKNLTTFSKSAIVNAVKHLLMQWAIDIWKDQESYFPISQRLNKFFFYYHIHQWETKKEVEELSWDLVKKFFIDFFFKEKGWFLLENFGDFSSFVLKEWEEKEKPIKIYEYALKYSNTGDNKTPSGTDNLYDTSVLEGAKEKSSYLFPQIKASEEYSSFISKLTHTGEIDLNLFKATWWTISDLINLTDGYRLGSLIHLYTKKDSFGESETGDEVITSRELKKSGNSTKLKISDNPLHIFLDKEEEEEEECLLIQKTIFSEEIQKKLQEKNVACLYGVKWLSSEQNGGGGTSNKKILASRESKGISFYYITKDSGLKAGGEESDKKSLDQQEPEVIQKVTKYLEDNFETIFLKFLVSKRGWGEENTTDKKTSFTLKPFITKTQTKKTWDFSQFFEQHSDVIDASIGYLDSLYWGQTVKKLQSILLSVYKNTPDILELEGNGEDTKKIKLPTKVGLFSPLVYKRNGTPKDEELDFFKLRETTQQNNGDEGGNEFKKGWFFEGLLEFLFGKEKDKQVFSLEQQAHKLRELLLKKEEERLFTSDSLENLFLNESFYRTQLNAITGDRLKATDTVFVTKSEEILASDSSQEFNEDDNFSSWLTKFIDSLNKKASESTSVQTEDNKWSDLIHKSLFLEPFLKSPLEKKIFLGVAEQVNGESSEGEGESENSNVLTTRAKNSWLLENFYLSDSAYESSSKIYQEFLAYLVSVKWMTHNNYSNISKVINFILSKNKNKNAYLVWTKEITEKEKEELEKANGQPIPQSSQQQSSDSKEKLKKFLNKENFSKDISNPLLRGEFTATQDSSSSSDSVGSSGTQNNQLNFSGKSTIYKVDAFKNGGPKNSGEKTKLSGFQGLVTESFSTRDLPKALKDYLFKDFLSLNSPENKNYSSEETNSAVSTPKKLIEGAFFSENQKRKLSNNQDILEILNNIKKKEKLLKYLDETINSLKDALKEKSKSINSLTLEELRNKLTESLKSNVVQLTSGSKDTANDELKDLYRLFNRFSGYIYSSSQKEKSPYIFTETKEGSDEKQYYVGFVYQVNQFDFDTSGIKEFQKELSEEALHTLISLLASNKDIREWIYKSEIVKQLSF